MASLNTKLQEKESIVKSKNKKEKVLDKIEFSEPNYFQCPNEMPDKMAAILSAHEYVILSIIIRKTKGWDKDTDVISVSQLKKMTNYSPTTISKCIENLKKRGVIKKKTRGNIGSQESEYKVVINVKKTPPPSKWGGTPPANGDTKETSSSKKKTNKQQAASAAVEAGASVCSSAKKKEKSATASAEPCEVPECLQKLEIPEKEKRWLAAHYDDITIQNAVAAAKSITKPIDCLPAMLKHLCKSNAKPSKKSQQKASNEESGKRNKETAKQVIKDYQSKANKMGFNIFEDGHQLFIKFTPIAYDDPRFNEMVERCLKEAKLK